ncbi:MAG: glycosyltransferase [Promethearchaeota archaeon]
MKILVCADHYPPNVHGGAEISLKIILEEIARQNKNINFHVVSPDTVDQELPGIKITNVLKTLSFDTLNNAWPLFDLVMLIKFLKVANKYKPDIIISQLYSSYPAIILGKIINRPVIVMIRDIASICPNKTGILNTGKNCVNFYDFKSCLSCFFKWKSISNPISSSPNKNKFSSIKKIIYVIQNIFRTSISLKLLKNNKYNWVASNIILKLMRLKISNVEKKNIIPVKIQNNNSMNILKDKNIKSNILGNASHHDELILLLSLPALHNYHKGSNFIMEEVLPKIKRPYKLYIAGGFKTREKSDDIIILGKISNEKMINFIKESDIILVPSVWYEAFGRIVLEGIFQDKNVIISPNVGIKEFIGDLPKVKEIPLIGEQWADFINEFRKESNVHDREQYLATMKRLMKFSPKSVARSFLRDVKTIIGIK